MDEQGRRYEATAEDSAYALVELEGGAIAHVSASWCVRPYRDDLSIIHADGTAGSAIAGLRECRVQPAVATPQFVWNPDIPQEIDPRTGWLEIRIVSHGLMRSVASGSCSFDMLCWTNRSLRMSGTPSEESS